MDGAHTNWPLIAAMFGYAFIGWVALFSVHLCIRRNRSEPQDARQVAHGYGRSWHTTRE
jgi:hypothetical protein